MMNIPYTKLSKHWKKPIQLTLSEAGSDLFSIEDYELKPWERKLFKTDIAAKIPEWYYGRIAPRSGLAYKHGIDVLAWVVDSSYTGNIWVILINLWQEPYIVKTGDRIAQYIIQPCMRVDWIEINSLEENEYRWEKGFWSSWR